MGKLPDAELVRLVTDVRTSGCDGFADPVTALAVILGESGGDPAAVGKSDPRDRGLWQINSRWHPDVDDAWAFDAERSTRYALNLSKCGTDFNPWHATRHPNFPTHLQTARAMLNANGPAEGGDDRPWWRKAADAVPLIPGGTPGVGPNVGDVIGVGEGAVDVATGVIDGAGDVLALLGKALRFLVSADFWRRVGFALAGVVLLYLGLAAIFGRQAVGLGVFAASRGTVTLPDDDQGDE